MPGRLGAEHEEPELAAQAAVVALAGLVQEALVLLQVGLLEERRSVDPAQHRPALVAAPVRAGNRGELDRLDALGRRPVRAQAEVREGAVAIERNGLDPLVANQVLDQLDLVGLVFGLEALERLVRVTSVRSNSSSAAIWRAIASSIFGRSSTDGRKSSGNSKS